MYFEWILSFGVQRREAKIESDHEMFFIERVPSQPLISAWWFLELLTASCHFVFTLSYHLPSLCGFFLGGEFHISSSVLGQGSLTKFSDCCFSLIFVFFVGFFPIW